MNTDKLVRGAIETLSKAIIFGMPKSYFTSDEKANKYMLTGDKKFSDKMGEHFTCGFGKAVLTPDDVSSGKYFIAGYDSNNPATGVLDDMYARAVYLDDNTGTGGVVMCAVDAVGISRKDINKIRKKVIIDSYNKAVAAGDKNVYFIDGATLFDGEFRESCTSDGAHPNDLGFLRMADKIGAVIARVMGME